MKNQMKNIDEIIKEAFAPIVAKLKDIDPSAHNMVSAMVCNDGAITYSAWVDNERVCADSFDELSSKLREFNPRKSRVESLRIKQAEIATELAKLENNQREGISA